MLLYKKSLLRVGWCLAGRGSQRLSGGETVGDIAVTLATDVELTLAGGKFGGGFWYQTHSHACWAEAYEFRDERDCFFPTKAGTVEAWGRSEQNPVGGWYGLRKGYRGRFGMYLPPLLEALGLVELTHDARNNRVRALPAG